MALSTPPAVLGGNVADLVRAAVARGADHPALVDGRTGGQVAWGALDAAVDAEVRRLRGSGVVPGARVLVRLPTSAAYCVAVFAVLRAGAVLVPVGTGATARELRHVLADSGAALVVAPADDPTVDGVVGAVPRLGPPGVSSSNGPDGAPATGGGEDPAVLAYTSGTSGGPRGVVLPHRALLANLEQCAALRPAPVTAADRVLLAVPLFHSYGLGPGLLQVAHAAATAVLLDRFDPAEALDVVHRARVTVVVGVPPMYRAWLDLPPGGPPLAEAFRTVRVATSGAAPLEPAVLAGVRAATGLDVHEGYGLTETGPVLTSSLGGGAKPGAVGRPLPAAPPRGVAGVELRLLDATGRPLPEVDDEDESPAGVVAVRGPNLFLGYWPDRRGGPGELPGLGDGWLRTGDVGYLDAEGDLHLVDRADDLIIVSGFNVYPHEVEDALREHPAVADAAAVGVPNPRSGERVRAVVVPVEGAAPTPEELVAHCAARLARFKVPVEVALVEQLPHSATGKLTRRLLREVPAAPGAAGPRRGADDTDDDLF